MSTMPRERHSVLGNIRRLASFAREHIPQVRGVSVLGGGLRNLDRMERNYGSDYDSRSNGFGRFSSPNSGNIASSGKENITASSGRMTSPTARDRDTIRNWRR